MGRGDYADLSFDSDKWRALPWVDQLVEMKPGLQAEGHDP